MGVLDTIESGFEAVETGIQNVIHKVQGEVQTLEAKFPSLTALEAKMEADIKGVVKDALLKAGQDILANGLTTLGFTTAGKDILVIAATEGVPLIMQDVMALLNIVVGGLMSGLTSNTGSSDASTEAPVVSDASDTAAATGAETATEAPAVGT